MRYVSTHGPSRVLCVFVTFTLLPIGCEGLSGDFGTISDSTDTTGCELIFTTPDQRTELVTGIKVVNSTGIGLSVEVRAQTAPLVGMQADMLPGACELYGLLPDTYDVTLRQCEQANLGSSTCTRSVGLLLRREINIQADQIVTIEATPDLF